MNKLETLFPPLEMCKQIPVGKFADSVYAYRRVARSLFETTPVYTICLHIASEKLEHYPAPTLAEILNDLPAPTCYRLGVHDWRVNLCNCPASDAVCSRNPATAALQLWLDINKDAEK